MAETFNGKMYSSDMEGKVESVVDELLLLDPYTTPLINLVGFGAPIGNIKHEWFEDAMYPTQTLVNGAVAVGSTSIVVDDVSPFQMNSVAKVGDELLLVTAINPTTKTLTVTRGYAGTTAAAIPDNAVIQFLFVEGVEGADARAARATRRTRVENISQIFDATIDVSGTAQALDMYGMGGMNQYDYNRQKALIDVAHQLEVALINGIYYESGLVRQMRGIRSFITTNVDGASNQALSKDMFNNLAQDIYNVGGFKGGSNYVIMVPPAQKVAVSNLDDGKVMIARADGARGQVVNEIYTDFGVFPVVMNNNLQPDELFLIDLNRISIRPLKGREFAHKFLGAKGDSVQGIIVGEYVLEFKQESAHGRIHSLKTS